MTEKLRFRDPELAKRVTEKIHDVAPKEETVKICHVCGTHEWTITHFGIRSLLPANVEVIAGPGCPVCIVPASEIDEAVQLALKGVTVTCFGDVLRVPGSKMSLLDAKAEGADVRVVYSVSDAVRLAEKEPNREFTFFAVGFETTAPSTAVEIQGKPSKNLSFLVSHRVIPPAMKLLAEMEDLNLDGFIAPGHVSTIIGLKSYEVFPQKYGMPTVVAGFEPLDVLFGVYMILKQLKERTPRLENEYTRAVTWEGNTKAQELMQKVFGVVDGNWRGLGTIPSSKCVFNSEYAFCDAHLKHDVKVEHGVDIQRGCKCHLVIIGKIKPTECPLFLKACIPQKPVGACMVSIEGTCRIWAREMATESAS
ncbi:MAG: hydrogenase formation protein HypD [Candidatus Bathyarchaeota archaeon]|jgi:hydrogenase expression/formation protein HypD|nr:hydrogenase formation protein HypD [Candidatus Bathyarchaeota archaeon A05DMB-5]MDH7557633.1 hydrogenase formation protein HypD [Candidatus Bathyarchaeota archaeon]